jgi:hypothetical protein
MRIQDTQYVNKLKSQVIIYEDLRINLCMKKQIDREMKDSMECAICLEGR